MLWTIRTVCPKEEFYKHGSFELMCFMDLQGAVLNVKYVQVIFIDIKEAKFRTLSLLVRHRVPDGIRALQEAPRSLCVSFHVCNCVHSSILPVEAMCSPRHLSSVLPLCSVSLPPFDCCMASMSTFLNWEGKSIKKLYILGISSHFFLVCAA